MYPKNEFPRVSEAISKEGNVVGPQLRELINDEKFDEPMNEVERVAWQQTFRTVTANIWGNQKA